MNKGVLEKFEYYSNLFDFYESLFTSKQKEYFKEYYFYDLSLSEIAENHNISRSAVFDTINKMHDSLNQYEKDLCLYAKYQKRNELYEKYLKKAQEENVNKDTLLELIKKMKENE